MNTNVPLVDPVDSTAAEDGTQFIVALCHINKTLGIACYDELSNTIYADCLNISNDDTEETLNNIKTAFRPTLFLIHPRIISNKSLMDSLLLGPDGTPDFYKFKVLKSSNWNESITLQLILKQLMVKEDRTHHISTANNYQKLASRIELENEQVRQSLGALLSFMQTTIFHLDEGRVIVNSIKPFPLESFMRIDNTSLKALQIYTEEIHPNVIKGMGRNKEGFSLFGLFDRTHSLPGRQKLREWMGKPYFDKQRILDRQLGISVVISGSNHEFIRSVTSLLRHIHDIPRLVLRIKKVQATYSDWCKLYSSVVYGVQITDILLHFIRTNNDAIAGGASSGEVEYVQSLIGLLNIGNVREVLHSLTVSIDFEASESLGVLTIRQGYDARLDELRGLYENLEQHLVGAAHKVLDIVPLLQNVSVEYVPQIGYLVAVQEDNVHFLQHSVGVKRGRTQQRPTTAFSRPQSATVGNKRANVIPVDPAFNPLQQQQQSNSFRPGTNASGRGIGHMMGESAFPPRTPQHLQPSQGSFFSDTPSNSFFSDIQRGTAPAAAPVYDPRSAPLSERDMYLFDTSINTQDAFHSAAAFGNVYNQSMQPPPALTTAAHNEWEMFGNHSRSHDAAGGLRPGTSQQRPVAHVVEQESDPQTEAFQFVYSQDGVHYFKHEIVYALDDSIGDVKSDILDRQRGLLLQLEESLLDFEPDLQHLSLTLATLDAIISLGTIAKEQRLVRPEIVTDAEQMSAGVPVDQVLIVKNGRHLLQELTVDSFIPNDTYVSSDKNVALVTGPNSSGKSVYIKQVGLIVYLAHIGSYVPAERAIISLTDAIYTRVNNLESVSNPLSSFAIDVTQMNKMLSQHTKRSLCIIDEFGKGTSPVDGIALLASTVKHFVRHKGKAFFVLHFIEIMHNSILSAQTMQNINCFCMETHKIPTPSRGSDHPVLDEEQEEDSLLTPLFKLKLGVSTSSEGMPCARHAGIAAHILQRAAAIKSSINSRTPISADPSQPGGYSALLRDQTNRRKLAMLLSSQNWLSEGQEQFAAFKALLLQ